MPLEEDNRLEHLEMKRDGVEQMTARPITSVICGHKICNTVHLQAYLLDVWWCLQAWLARVVK